MSPSAFQCCVHGSKDLFPLLFQVADAEGCTALHMATKLKSKVIAEELVKAKVDIEAVDSKGLTPLQWACKAGNVAAAEYLICQGARCDVTDKDGTTLLMEVSEAGIMDLVNLLANRQVLLNAQCNTTEDTALHLAIANAHTSVAEFLASRGASLSVRNRSGNTPLHLAVMRGYLDLVEGFLENTTADFSLQTASGQSLLTLAIQGGHYELAKFLIAHGCLLLLDPEEHTVLLELLHADGAEEVLVMILESGGFDDSLIG